MKLKSPCKARETGAEAWVGVGWEEVINAGIIIVWLHPRADEMKRILFSDWLSERIRYAYLVAHQEIFFTV